MRSRRRVPTQRPDIVPDAQKIGENSVDTDKPITPEAKPKPVDMTSAPPPAPTPVEKPKPEDVPKPQEKPKPIPATEVAPEPQPKEEVKPEPVKQTEPKPTPAKEPAPTPPEDKTAAIEPKPEVKPDAVAEAIAQEPPTETTQLPDSAPAPEARPKPKPAQAESAKAPDRKDAEKPVKEASSKPKSDEKQFNADEISALLDKQKPSGGGAKRSTQQSSLGGDKDQGAKLSKSEQGALEESARRLLDPAGRAGGFGEFRRRGPVQSGHLRQAGWPSVCRTIERQPPVRRKCGARGAEMRHGRPAGSRRQAGHLERRPGHLRSKGDAWPLGLASTQSKKRSEKI